MKVLVVVDMQNDFIDGALANQKGKEVTENVIKEIGKDYDYYALTRDSHESNYLNTLEGKNLPVEHCIINSEGWQLNKGVEEAVKKTNKTYKIFDKNGFGSYELTDELEGFKDTIESISVVGLCTDICVITNALMLRAKFPNIPMYYVEDAMFGLSSENQASAIRVLEACQIYKKK